MFRVGMSPTRMGASVTYDAFYRSVELKVIAQNCGELQNGSWCYAPFPLHLAGSPRAAFFVSAQFLSRIIA